MAVAVATTSAAPLLAMLEEEDDQLKVYALGKLDDVVSQFWFQISNYIPQVEALCEDTDFTHRESASLLASKVFYYLRELDEAVNYALGAGDLFDVNDKSEYVQTLIARCLDKYFELRQAAATGGAAAPMDARLETIAERMIQRCCDDGQLEQAIGITLESRRLDATERVIALAPDTVTALRYTLSVAKTVVSRAFREQVLRLVIRLYETVPQIGAEDWVTVCQCLMVLDDANEVARVLGEMLESADESRALLAYQIAFDLFDNDMQAFMQRMQARLDTLKPGGNAIAAAAAPADGAAADGDADIAAAPAAAPVPEGKSIIAKKYDVVSTIISGTWPIHLQLEFLYWHNAADLTLLKNMKQAFDPRVSICHTATVTANAFMLCGTTVDTFLRDNLDWLARATNWAKFGATASLGVIHRGHLQQTTELMAPHLPREGRTVSPYSQGGALYALGIIHAGHGHAITAFLTTSLRQGSHEVVQHGACLGLGLAALGTDNTEIYDELKEVLYTDSAVAGEAAGMAMGLLCTGSEEESAKKRCEEMLAYAHDTAHEKIIRGLGLGLAVIAYGREEGADSIVDSLTLDQDPSLRYGGMYAIGMAYRGTDNNSAISRLLHFAVSDVSDDVRRAAVLNLGFVLLGVPEQCPRIVKLLSESYNPHLRYGAAMAVGIACAATGLKEAQAFLKPMLKDRVDFVRQGALIALALVLVQQPESAGVGDFRKHLESTYSNKHEDVMCKMGAIMATGIIDAGGRNATVGMISSSGYFRRTAIISMALFTQYWYWFPMAYMLSLTFKATAVIVLDSKLKLPQMSVACDCKKGLFAYAKPATETTNKKVSKVPTAILSTTKKAQQRAKAKAQAKAADGSSMDVDEAAKPAGETSGEAAAGGADAASGTATATEASKEAEKAAAEAAAAAEKEAEDKDNETCPFMLENPARVTPTQEQYIRFDPSGRFQPLKANARAGILVMRDTRPGEVIQYVEKQSLGVPPAGPAAASPAPAAPAAAVEEPEAPNADDLDDM